MHVHEGLIFLTLMLSSIGSTLLLLLLLLLLMMMMLLLMQMTCMRGYLCHAVPLITCP